MSLAPIRDLYRACVPSLLQDVIRKTVIQPALTMEMVIAREIGRHFPEGAEPHIQALLRRILRPGDTFVDVGANFGALSVAAANLIGPGGSVICFEPVPANFARLTKNLKQSMATKVTLVLDPRAIGAERGAVEMHLNFWDGCHTIDATVNMGSRTGSLMVDQVTLDEALQHHQVQHVHVLKVDVEGAELRVLAGASGLLRAGRIDAIVLEVCDPSEPGKADNAKQVAGLLEGAGFTGHQIGGAGLNAWDWRSHLARQDVLFTRPSVDLCRLISG
jgi:FkbM family methyltransferase